MKATAIANSNIAFIKYWGKRDENLILPMNPSISMTLDENLSTTTTVEFSGKYSEDILILNNVRQEGNKLERVSKFLDLIRKNNLRAKVVSINTFPTGTGIASSASGFAALAAAASKSLGLSLESKNLSALARQGSGSASRSVYGGFAEWKDEYAVQIKDENYWPELIDVIVIISKEEKKNSSRDAMRETIEKSKLYKKRIAGINKAIEGVKSAILNRDFPLLCKTIMEDSDSMHACIEEIGIKYLDNNSKLIKQKIINLNRDGLKAAYSFDAGPNTHIITMKRFLPEIEKLLKSKKYIVSGQGHGIRYSEEHLF